MKQKFQMFMTGRNGNDRLNMFLLALSLILIIISPVAGGAASRILNALILVLFVLIYFRMFSRNIIRRREENERYLRIRGKIVSALRIRKERWIQRKDYKFFKCPSCKTALRVPRGHGSINIVCRKCGTSFRGKS